MSDFEIPQGAPLPTEPVTPPVDPMVAREQQIADNTRAEEAPNSFLAAKQNALFEAPDAYFRNEGSDAIHAAPTILDTLSKLRDEHLAGLANDAQRNRLAPALDAHLDLARDDVARHVAEQSLAWQRRLAQDRIAILQKEAAYHHNDDDRVEAIGQAAASAARAHARVGDRLDQQAEDAAAALARSGILSAAIQARLDRGKTESADALLEQANGRLDPTHTAVLQAQLQQASQAEGTTPAPAVPDVQPDAAPTDVQTAQSVWPLFGKPPYYVPKPSSPPEATPRYQVPIPKQSGAEGKTTSPSGLAKLEFVLE